jgi:hypothetical protein
MRISDSKILLVLLLIAAAHPAYSQRRPGSKRAPIIDMHLHAFRQNNPPPPNPVTGTGPVGGTALDATLSELKRYSIVKAVLSGPAEDVRRWRDADPGRFIGGVFMSESVTLPEVSILRQEFLAGRFAVLGELGLQYAGLSPNDPQLDAYFSFAEELDVPVGVHTGLGPPRAPYEFAPKFRARLGNPLLLEEVLIRHPRLRLYIMHAGWPYLSETVALMYMYPQVYADLSAINWLLPREEFHNYLRALVRAGLGKRLMFGSDQMFWAEAVGMAVEGIDSADFLTAGQKRDIFYHNAARFLKLDKR